MSVSWKAAWQDAAFRRSLVGTLALLVIVLTLFSWFLGWVEQRSGAVLDDPLISTIDARDFTWPIFLLIYGSLVLGLSVLVAQPHQLIVALQAYILMVCIRFGAMYVTPLDPPPGIIPLADPLVQFFGSGAVPTRDLFFSGHTSTLLVLAFATGKPWPQWAFILSALCVGIMIVWQHVHYTIDVAVAPVVAFACYRLASSFNTHS